MSQPQAPLDVALAFTKAWTSHDLDTAKSLVGDDVAFEGPGKKSARSLDDYIRGLRSIEGEVSAVRLISALGNETEALLMYELTTRDLGKLVCAKRLVVRDGNIRHDTLTFDTSPMHKKAA